MSNNIGILPGDRIEIASDFETKRFLTDISTADVDRARELWDKYSGAKGLLDAGVTGRRGGRYVYDRSAGEFRKSPNRRVTRNDLNLYVRRVATGAKKDAKKETQQMIAGAILFSVWYSRMREILKSLYYTIWVLNIGGFIFDDNTARNIFYLWVISQYKWLDNFASQINSGKQAMNGWAVTRAGMYAEFGNALHQNLLLDKMVNIKGMEAKRVLGENENHCRDSESANGCVELAEKGWMPAGEMTPIGKATCKSHCHCIIIYRIERKRV